ncbi:MAG: UDP-2,3-diacylglucosamine diphosphatase LpxI [Deltaproteobacteria bacterium]|nr:UDP-2,3-diacylglucosamine diphosphatase LpxI [Deltaproteobacteria bacterium]
MPASTQKPALGIIAGSGRFPLLVARSAREAGLRVVAIAHKGETDPALEQETDTIVWIRLGQLGQLIRNLKKHGVRNAVMAGAIKKRRMFENVLPDLKGLSLMSRLVIFHDDDILRAVARELAKEGIEIVSSTTHVPDLIAPPGILTRRKPSKNEKEDMAFGWRIAKDLGRLDIGQCVVVRQKTVLALEAIEGTDETILRGGRLGREKTVVVKVSKPNQDLRFDVPSVGVGTIKTMIEAKAGVLVVEAGKTLLFDRKEMISLADEKGIAIASLEEKDIPVMRA